MLSISVVSSSEPFGYNSRDLPLLDGGDFCSVYGCKMFGDIDMDNNSIFNANWFNVTYLNVTTIFNSTTICLPDGCISSWSDVNTSTGGSSYDDDWINTTIDDKIVANNITVTDFVLYVNSTNNFTTDVDGGFSNSVYLASQLIDGGTA